MFSDSAPWTTNRIGLSKLVAAVRSDGNVMIDSIFVIHMCSAVQLMYSQQLWEYYVDQIFNKFPQGKGNPKKRTKPLCCNVAILCEKKNMNTIITMKQLSSKKRKK